MLCESRCIRNIYLPIGQNGSYGHAALNWRIFKISLWDSLESDYHKLSRFLFNRLYDDSLCLCTLWGKEQLAVKLPDDFSARISSCLVIHLILSSKVRFWFTKGITLLKRTLEHWARGTFFPLITKEQNVMVTETNTPLILIIAFAIEKKTKTQQNKYSVVGVFWSRLDLKTAGDKPLLSVFVEIFVWCTRFSFIGLNRARNFYFFFATWVRCITTLGRACWR